MSLDVQENSQVLDQEMRRTQAGWMLITMFVLAGLLGFLGSGLWSHSSASSPGGALEVEYNRVANLEADSSVTLTLHPASAVHSAIALDVTGTWIDGIDVSSISPTPAEESLTPDGLHLTFPVDEIQEDGNLRVSIQFRASDTGFLSARGAIGSDAVDFNQFVLP